MKIEFFGQSARDASHLGGTSSRLVNLYREPMQGRSRALLRSVLGMADHADLAGPSVRAMAEVSGGLYAAAGGYLWQVRSDGSASSLGAIADDENTTISGNNGKVLVVCGGKYYRWNGTVLQEPTPGAFTSIGSVGYIGNYTVLSQRGGRQFLWSDPGDPDTLPGLNYAIAGAVDDIILRVMGISGALWVFKTQSIETWYNTEQPGAFAFLPVTGGALEYGLRSHRLLCAIPNGAFFVNSRGQAMVLLGQAQAVSTPAVETAIKDARPRSVFYYEDRGHGFACVTFRDCPAWCYDLATGEWHERAETVNLSPWTATCAAQMGRTWYLGRDGGSVASMSRSNRDGSAPLKRVAVSASLANDGQRFRLAEAEVFGRFGVNAATVMLELSRDGGLTWGPERQVTMPTGAYDRRCIWRGLGQFRQATARISMTDPVDVPIEADGRAVVA